MHMQYACNVERRLPKPVPNQIALAVIVQNYSENIPDTTESGIRVVGFVRIFSNVFLTSISGSSTTGRDEYMLKGIIALSIFL